MSLDQNVFSAWKQMDARLEGERSRASELQRRIDIALLHVEDEYVRGILLGNV